MRKFTVEFVNAGQIIETVTVEARTVFVAATNAVTDLGLPGTLKRIYNDGSDDHATYEVRRYARDVDAVEVLAEVNVSLAA